jgi:hypothetical protein
MLMKRKNISILSSIFFLLFLLGMMLSCNEQLEHQGTEFQSKTNPPPVITSITISPNQPNRESELSLSIQSHNPGGNPLTYRYQWIKNDKEIPGENKESLKSENFKKGDFIRVKVVPSDGEAVGEPFLSGPVKILNSPPVIQEVRIEPKMAYANDHLKVHVKSNDIDRDFIYYTYQWEKNGAVLTEEKGEVLERGRFKKGDSIAVTVTPNDGESQGISKKSEPITILNSPPIIISSPPTSVEGNDYIYQVKAYDPDNDPIFFTLKSGPKGMEIDKDTGLIRWAIRSQDRGTHSIEIEASDKEGAKSFQRFVLNIEIR